MHAIDIEALRKVFANREQVTIARAVVEIVELLPDNSKIRARCKVIPDDFQVVAEQAFESATTIEFIQPDDFVLLCFASPDDAIIIKRLTSTQGKIPTQAVGGHAVYGARSGKKAYLQSDAAALIGRGSESDPDEPLVLGNVLLSYLADLHAKVDSMINLIATGPVAIDSMGGTAVTHPELTVNLTTIQLELEALREQYVSTPATNVVSQVAFTER